MDEAEAALLILADPLTWRWHPHVAGEGIWEGSSNEGKYRIRAPIWPNNVDAPLLDRLWSLGVNIPKSGHVYVAPLAALEQAKAICVRHAASGNVAEINALDRAAKAEAKAFKEKEKTASKQLFSVVQKRPVLVFMKWHPDNIHGQDATEFSATGKNGVYLVQFDPARRWVVRRTEHQQVEDEHCFLTSRLAKIACTVHNFSGEWHGMMAQ